VGLIEQGITADLERDALKPEDAQLVGRATIILSTGCVGYVTEKTYTQLLRAQRTTQTPPWIVSFVLRMFPYEALASAMSDVGLVTERLAGATFVQRRFRDVEEFTSTLNALDIHGIDTNGLEAEGTFQADLFVSRPEADVRATPLDELITINSGRNRQIGTRYVQVETGHGMEIALEP
jgi:hypothetical protein